MENNSSTAILALADGTIFHGTVFGAFDTVPNVCGELVFNTSMSGYQEIISDPSYCEQIVMFTQPHIGNVGVNLDDVESNVPDKIWAKGIVIKSQARLSSNWRAQDNLNNYLKKHQALGISHIDTRHLTNILRTSGSQNCCIYVIQNKDSLTQAEQTAVSLAQQTKSLVGLDLAKKVSTDKNYEWTKNSCNIKTPTKNQAKTNNKSDKKHHVVVYDFGVKQQILNLLVDRQCQVTVVPAETPVNAVLALQPNGILLSNGPGDPAACTYAIENTKHFIKLGLPIFGICLGFQILGLALDGKTSKMKFGHHGANHPVKDYTNNMVLITSQNHGFTVDESSLNDSIEITHKSLFDGSLQGIMHKTLPVFGFQGHPEASPGPTDIQYLFDKFINHLEQYNSSNTQAKNFQPNLNSATNQSMLEVTKME